jgi:hypothetical protein
MLETVQQVGIRFGEKRRGGVIGIGLPWLIAEVILSFAQETLHPFGTHTTSQLAVLH